MRILLVDDHEHMRGPVGRELQRDFGHEVTTAKNPAAASACMEADQFDVIIVDILYNDLDIEFNRRRLAREVTPTSAPLLISGLSLIRTARNAAPVPGTVLWTSGEPNRHLHMPFAYEELGVRVFCSKSSGDGKLDVLNSAARHAAAGQRWIDNVLEVYLPRRGSISVAKTLLGEKSKRVIWRALALGYQSRQSIERVVDLKRRTIGNLMTSMMLDLAVINPGLQDDNHPQSELAAFATAHREFFLDEAVRQAYP